MFIRSVSEDMQSNIISTQFQVYLLCRSKDHCDLTAVVREKEQLQRQ